MKRFNLLIVTDHRAHNDTNSLYALSRALRDDPRCNEAWVSTRGLEQNQSFFKGNPGASFFGTKVNDSFHFQPEGKSFLAHLTDITNIPFDAIVIRLPQPVDVVLLKQLETMVPESRIINRPSGIIETASKAFLTKLPHLCPSPFLVKSKEEALALSREYELVLKPLYSYGGRGLIRISKDFCWRENERFELDRYADVLQESVFPMLSMRFLKNVYQGDKRTIVINKKNLASALRMPAPGHWVCNVAQGGTAVLSEPDQDELAICEELTPLLFEKGIFMYGFDTLVNDDGRRVLSEINTLSIGGLMPMQELSGRPIIQNTAESMFDYLSM